MNINQLKKYFEKKYYKFVHLKITNSTMLDAKKFLEKNNKNCIILADEQIKGKGRRGSKWISPKGNIYFSISVYEKFNLEKHFFYSIVTAISIKSALEFYGAKSIKYKWSWYYWI